jgi:hypothetical protein
LTKETALALFLGHKGGCDKERRGGRSAHASEAVVQFSVNDGHVHCRTARCVFSIIFSYIRVAR